MAEEYTCIECEHLYDDRDGDTDERMCNKCLNKERRNPDIHRSSTVHYPDWDMKKKEYVVPPKKRYVRISDVNKEIAKEWKK